MTKGRNGFTLIELLVVIAVIGVLSSIVLVTLSSTRDRARDAKRKIHFKEISKALEFYYSDNDSYPVYSTGPGECDTSLGEINCALPPNDGEWDDTINGLHLLEDGDYLTVLPPDPINNSANYYQYEVCTANGQSYILKTILEDPPSTFIVGGGISPNLVKADTNNNGIVDIFDAAAIAGCIGQPVEGACAFADLDGNGAVEIDDVLFAQANFGSC
jgi:prepilin-type N-terminal cleavage/methylation domain-containing protein